MPGNDQLPFLADATKYKNPVRSIKLWTGILGKQMGNGPDRSGAETAYVLLAYVSVTPATVSES